MIRIVLSAERMRKPAELGALDEQGNVRVLPAEFWHQFTRDELAMFCVQQALYCVPTTELVEWLRTELGPGAIEIGAGAGLLAKAVGIPATDSKQQDRPDVRAYYRSLGQPTIRYGSDVRKLDAVKAIRLLKPRTVLAAWVTHRFRPAESWRQGNEYGVEEEKILDTARYVFVGNEHVHRYKPLLEIPHRHLHFPWLVSRAMTDDPDFIGIWERRRTT